MSYYGISLFNTHYVTLYVFFKKYTNEAIVMYFYKIENI
jgi:hypothetical protein